MITFGGTESVVAAILNFLIFPALNLNLYIMRASFTKRLVKISCVSHVVFASTRSLSVSICVRVGKPIFFSVIKWTFPDLNLNGVKIRQ